MKIHTLNREIRIPVPLDEVFNFFSVATNLQQLTPASLRFEILTEQPIRMEPGTLIEYRLRLLGVPFRWLTEITAWEPGVRFVDVQRRGPYQLWEHEHVFEGCEGGTLVRDNLQYRARGGPLEPAVNIFVRRQVNRIFDYRELAIRGLFGSMPEPHANGVGASSKRTQVDLVL